MGLPDLARVTGFEWDAGNARKNEKHGVSQEEAEQVFGDPGLILLEDPRHSGLEARYRALGRTAGHRLLHVTFTTRAAGTLIRVISARPMKRKERPVYESQEAQAHSPLQD